MRSVNDPPDPKTDTPNPVPRFVYDELRETLDKIERTLRRNLTPVNKVNAIHAIIANARLDRQEEAR
jgi:hypothetical protein